MTKTNKRHFETFKTECEKWIAFFGLKSWKVCYTHEEMTDARADVFTNLGGRVATIRLAKKWDTIITEKDVKLSAFHEVCELFIARLTTLAQSRYITASELEEANHEIIRTLERVVFEAD